MKRHKRKSYKEIRKEIKRVHLEFDNHLKDTNGEATSGCGACNEFWGQLRSLEWVIGIGDWE
jgi:hypothetical protein